MSRIYKVGMLHEKVATNPVQHVETSSKTILRHSRIQTTLDLYTQDDRDETLAAQGQFLQAMGLESRTIQ